MKVEGVLVGEVDMTRASGPSASEVRIIGGGEEGGLCTADLKGHAV